MASETESDLATIAYMAGVADEKVRGRAAVAELVECLTEIDAWLKTGDGDGAAIQARADVILSRHQAGLGKGEDR